MRKDVNAPAHDKTNKMACAPSEDQPRHLPSLIRFCNLFTLKSETYPFTLKSETNPFGYLQMCLKVFTELLVV